MTERRPTMMYPPIEALLDKVDSKFTLVSLTGRRAREITTYFSQLGQGLGSIVPPQVASRSHKPVSIALEEIYAARIVPVYKSRGDGGEDTPTDAVESAGP